MNAQKISGVVRWLFLLPILLCIGVTLSLVIKHTKYDDTTLRAKEILTEYETTPAERDLQ